MELDAAPFLELRSVQRTITLLPVLCKLLTRCILARIRSTLEEAQPVEQAGFRRNFSTLDHIATCRRLIEASRGHRLPLVMTFIDYKKAFNSVEPLKVWEALEEQGVERIYVDVLRECYSHCTTVFHPFYNDVVVAVWRGVRQGDPKSPNLFPACLEHVIRRCNCDFGVNIDGVRLNHLRFADDIVLITDSPEHASETLRCCIAWMRQEATVVSPSILLRPK
uniref:Reverse transcriptase domain-containing protein n=1 Tax=Haemonchus contortus TaxID=6289 RepID=A0A7I4YXJ4_HAECO